MESSQRFGSKKLSLFLIELVLTLFIELGAPSFHPHLTCTKDFLMSLKIFQTFSS